jgi:6-phosphofructo-2-kinase / fructose-2,6-biphosphatase 3
MGTSGSKGIDGVGAVSGVGAGAAGLGGVGAGGDGGEGAAAEAWHGGAQLYVSLKMENALISGDLVPHVYGSEPIIGTWDPSRAVRTTATHQMLVLFAPLLELAPRK